VDGVDDEEQASALLTMLAISFHLFLFSPVAVFLTHCCWSSCSGCRDEKKQGSSLVKWMMHSEKKESDGREGEQMIL
jgi:hypothetical protein